jgi:hypothetical protein
VVQRHTEVEIRTCSAGTRREKSDSKGEPKDCTGAKLPGAPAPQWAEVASRVKAPLGVAPGHTEDRDH